MGTQQIPKLAKVAGPEPEVMDTHSGLKPGDSWQTPDYLKQALKVEFDWDLDPCPYEPNWTPGVHKDGLAINWDGKKVYVNPPYSDIERWVTKALDSKALTVLLLPSRTDTDWFRLLLHRGAEIRFFRKRVHFNPPPGCKRRSPPEGNLLAIVRNL